ncbi:XRE family transcriptional regulator [Streptomyces sp. NBC_01558]|uniref:helix-turn-helix domain-containing protein n=1 Tax=Streptomyces sp. NBC_01558 TaxID=2975878 RepID=UPI002DDC7299|nr:XRE family transcriptional regulator [Streptomyces sp. NBC_01558]WSD81913.1 XRE family transcriptional regulator [Streptomyces sp. NBC_01558]
MKATPLWGDKPDVEVYGERLRDARLIQRLRSGEVAVAAGISQSWYSKLEHAISTTVEWNKADSLAQALGFPVNFLSSPPVTAVQRGSLLFRAKKSLPKSEEDQLVSWSRLVGDLIHAAEPRLRLPLLRIPRVPAEMSATDAARAVRQALGFSHDEPIPHLIRTLERGGVYVATIDFDGDLHAKNHDAFSTWIGAMLDRPLIGIRASDSWERTRMSVAHELGHLAMHQTRREGDLESEAYSFAAELLMPLDVLRREWPRSVTLTSLIPLKKIWGMSLASLIEHGYRNGLLFSAQRTSLYKQLSNRRDPLSGERMRVREPGWRDREAERPKLVATVAEKAFGSDLTAEALGDEVFSWRADYLRALLGGQVTEWAQKISCEEDESAATDDSLADVIQLNSRSRAAAR